MAARCGAPVLLTRCICGDAGFVALYEGGGTGCSWLAWHALWPQKLPWHCGDRHFLWLPSARVLECESVSAQLVCTAAADPSKVLIVDFDQTVDSTPLHTTAQPMDRRLTSTLPPRRSLVPFLALPLARSPAHSVHSSCSVDCTGT